MKKALFLDRDGVINVELHYLYKIEKFKFIEGIFELCRYYQTQGYLIFVVTNQSGIARGYYNESDFNILTSWMTQEFQKEAVNITKVYYCPHHPDISGECSCRKPKNGMILKAKNEYDLDLRNSVLIGDKESDIEAAKSAGILSTYLFDEKKRVEKSKATKIVSKLEEIYSANT